MDTLIIQYIVIAIVFVFAVYYMARRFWPSKRKKSSGCDKGCGCATTQPKETGS